jgi:hypothetical protein
MFECQNGYWHEPNARHSLRARKGRKTNFLVRVDVHSRLLMKSLRISSHEVHDAVSTGNRLTPSQKRAEVAAAADECLEKASDSPEIKLRHLHKNAIQQSKRVSSHLHSALCGSSTCAAFFLASSTTGGSSTDRFFGASLVPVYYCACCAASASCAARSRCSWAAACFLVWYRDNLRSAARRNVGIDALVRLLPVHDKILVDRTLHRCAFQNRGCVGKTQACLQLPGLSACPHW